MSCGCTTCKLKTKEKVMLLEKMNRKQVIVFGLFGDTALQFKGKLSLEKSKCTVESRAVGMYLSFPRAAITDVSEDPLTIEIGSKVPGR